MSLLQVRTHLFIDIINNTNKDKNRKNTLDRLEKRAVNSR